MPVGNELEQYIRRSGRPWLITMPDDSEKRRELALKRHEYLHRYAELDSTLDEQESARSEDLAILSTRIRILTKLFQKGSIVVEDFGHPRAAWPGTPHMPFRERQQITRRIPEHFFEDWSIIQKYSEKGVSGAYESGSVTPHSTP